jgi:hypothetical protein
MPTHAEQQHQQSYPDTVQAMQQLDQPEVAPMHINYTVMQEVAVEVNCHQSPLSSELDTLLATVIVSKTCDGWPASP